jgi:hypothetical protein
VSSPTESADRSKSGDAEAVLVETAATDPLSALEAASTELDDGPLLAVLTTTARERFERRLTEVGVDLDESLVIDLQSPPQPGDGPGGGVSEPRYGDVAGLSMELVGRFDRLAEQGGVVYLDALEPLVELAGLESAFRFLVIVVARARAVGVPLVARIDPDAVDRAMTGTLAEAFDRVVEAPVDGSAADD